MTVRSAWTADSEFGFTGVGYAPDGQVTSNDTAVDAPVGGDVRDLLLAAGLANNARLVPPDDGGHERWTVLGDPTEAALKVAAAKAAIDLGLEAAASPRVSELPFDSHRKRMATVHAADGGRVVYVKGAPRELVARCTTVRRGGCDVPLDPGTRAAVEAANDTYSRDALRVLAVATRRLPDTVDVDDAERVECDLVLLGLVGMLDPPHPEVSEAIARCRSAGIRVVMMTGDYGLTAESVARRAEPGPATPCGRRITGDGCDRDVLDRAGVDRADGLAAVTGSDEVNAVLARLAVTRLNVPRVVARIYAPAKAEIYRRLGVQTISPVTWGVERLTELLTFSELAPVASLGTGQVEIVDAAVPALLDGRPAAELTVPGETHVVAITRHGATLLNSGPSTPLQAGDIVHVAVTGTVRLSELLGHD